MRNSDLKMARDGKCNVSFYVFGWVTSFWYLKQFGERVIYSVATDHNIHMCNMYIKNELASNNIK